jgi:hypothetical protein
MLVFGNRHCVDTYFLKSHSLASRGGIMIKEIYIEMELFVRSRDTFLQYRSDDAILIGVDHH